MPEISHAIGIGELARRAGCKPETVRYYERIGLMGDASRTEGGQRRYGEEAVRRLTFIRHARDFGFSVDAVRELLAMSDQPDMPCQEVDAVAKQIENATEQWLHVEDRANEINAASREIAGKINAEAREFTEFLQKANDTEKNHLRLEVDKLNRAQVDWVKVVTGMLDHVFALNQAGRQSGQEKLVRQLDNFQVACRDVARRVGVVTYEPKPEEGFDTGKHQLRDPEAEPEVGAKIIGIAAQGLSHQGQVLRKAVVVIEGEEPGQAPPDASKPKAKAKAKKKA